MKIKSVLLSASLAVPALMTAQPQVLGSDAQAFLTRGKLMYEAHNYTGAIDQLSQMKNLPSCTSMQEQADYYIALSKFERDEKGTLEALQSFMEKYPSSTLIPDVLMRIGNYHFYRGDYGMALTAYTQVRRHALNDDLDEDLVYRIAYCDLQLEDYDEARSLYEQIKDTKRYADAVCFFNAYIDYAKKDYASAYEQFAKIDRSGELGYQSQYYMCQIDYTNKDYSRVISLGESLLNDNANDYFNPEINRLVGEAYYHTGNTAKARKHLNTYIATTQDAVMRSAAYALGVMDYNDGNHTAALKDFGQVTGPDDALSQSAYFYTGQSQLAQGNTRAAAMAFDKAAKMDYDKEVKENAFYNYAVTQSHGASDPFGAGITLFESFLNEYPHSKYRSQVETHLVNAYMSTTNYEKALASIERIEKPSASILKAKQTVLYNMGVQALQKGNKTSAANYLKQAIKVGKYDKKIYNESRLWLAEAQYLSDDYASTVENLTSYVKEADKTDTNYGKALYNLGYAQYQQQNYEEARKSFESAIASGKLDKSLVADAYDRIADTYYYAGDFKKAEEYYDSAISNSLGDADGSMFDKAMMAGQMKENKSKIDQLDALLKKYPESTKAPAAMLEKARAYEAMGKQAEAIKEYAALANKYPKSAQARKGLLQMASIEKNKNDIDKAIDAYKQVIVLAPTSDESKIAAEDLKDIYADHGKLPEYKAFLDAIPNAPQFDTNEMEQLTFNAAEKAITDSKPSVAKMQNYLANYPDGAFAAKAKYYVGRFNYENGKLNEALPVLNEALAMGEDASWAEDALSMKSDILARQGKADEAIGVYQQIIERSTSDDNKIVAQMGVVSAALSTKKYDMVVTTANDLLNSASLTNEELNEVRLDRAVAYAALGQTKEAEADLKQLAKDMDTEVGAQAAYELAEMKFNAGDNKGAEKQINNLLESGTSQAYWIARAYLLESDILLKEGKTADAREYLESLRDNYPGKEKDIFKAIDNRLSAIKAKTSKKVTKKK